MADATVAPPSNILPKAPVLATPGPGAVKAPVIAPPKPVETPAPAPSRSPAMLVGAGAIVLAIAGATFVIASKLDSGSTKTLEVDAGAAVVVPVPPVVIDAGAPPLVVVEVDAGVDAGVSDIVDAGVVKQPSKGLLPPSAADLLELKAIDEQIKTGAWEEAWARRGSTRSRFTSNEGLREFFVRMVEISCQRGDLSNANSYMRQLADFGNAAKDLAKKRCKKHRDWDL